MQPRSVWLLLRGLALVLLLTLLLLRVATPRRRVTSGVRLTPAVPPAPDARRQGME
jgi:hypothetical protein